MDETVTIDGQSKTIHRIDTGVPHAVLVVDDLDNIPVDVLGPAIRYHNHFAPEGTNVNFIQPAADGTVRIRTYERGVEAETLACGTGSVAGAIVASQLYNLTPPIRMIVMSGLPLDISFLRNSEGYREVYLKGEARVVYRGHLEEETW